MSLAVVQSTLSIVFFAPLAVTYVVDLLRVFGIFAPAEKRHVEFDPTHLTAAQLRAACQLIGWHATDLADASGVGIATIRAYYQSD